MALTQQSLFEQGQEAAAQLVHQQRMEAILRRLKQRSSSVRSVIQQRS